MTDTQVDRLSKEREKYLWRLFEQMRDQISLGDFSQVSQWLQDHGEKLTVSEFNYFLERLGARGSTTFAPVWLSRFIVQLLHTQQSTVLLDPIGGLGLWAASIAEQDPQFDVDVVCKLPVAKKVYNILDAELPRLHIGDFQEVRPQFSQKYDAIVSFPPVGTPRETRTYPTPTGEVKIKDDSSLLVALLDASQLLRPEGKLLVLVPQRFVDNPQPKSIRRNLPRLGLHLAALLHIRPDTFSFTNLSFDLAIIEHRDQDGLYVAEIPKQYEVQDQLLQCLSSRKPGNTLQQGRVVDPNTFRGFEVFVAEDAARQMARHQGLVEKPFSEVVSDIHFPNRNPEVTPFEEHSNAIYLPTIGAATSQAVTSQAELPKNPKSYAQLIVDPKAALPEYLADLFNTSLGHELRKAAMQGSTIPRIRPHDLQAMTLYLPPLEDQRRVLEALQKIRVLRSELEEMESRLWNQPRNSADILESISTINHEERFQDWLESLPFPLASTLRAYYTVDQTDKAKYERLLHFFESLAIFCTTILVSACRHKPQIWVPAQEKISKSFEDQGLSLSRPTFGVWRIVLGALSKSVRQLLNGESRAICLSLFCLSNPEPLVAICSKELVTILEQVNTYRNRWTGHGGHVPREESKSRHKQVREKLLAFRQLFGMLFTQYELIRPGKAEVLPGAVYRYSVERVMGSNPMLEQEIIELSESAVTDLLHCWSPGQRRALELVPFFQLRETPQACYFFNRIEKSVPYFISYQPASTPEIEDEEQGEIILNVIADFELKNQELDDADN